ncbi:hypothetical protein Trydic_g1352 [Trypoxylus dichotomus]
MTKYSRNLKNSYAQTPLTVLDKIYYRKEKSQYIINYVSSCWHEQMRSRTQSIIQKHLHRVCRSNAAIPYYIRSGTRSDKDSALARLPLHENQYTCRSGKSCGQAIHELARQRLPLGTRKFHWLPFWTLRAPLTGRPPCQLSGLCKDVKSSQRSPGRRWQPAARQTVCYQFCSSACWWMICYPIFGRRVPKRRATPMILSSWLRAWYLKACKSHSGS